MNSEKVYLTFQTDRETALFLKAFAHRCKMTQPELIEQICKDFKEKIIEAIKDDLNKNKEE